MATIMYKLTGGVLKTESAATLGELKAKLGLDKYTSVVKYGESVSTESESGYELQDGMVIQFSDQFKGA